MAQWEAILLELEGIVNHYGLNLSVCSIDVLSDEIPETLVTQPYKSFLTKEHRMDQLPELALLSHDKRDPKLLGVYGLHI